MSNRADDQSTKLLKGLGPALAAAAFPELTACGSSGRASAMKPGYLQAARGLAGRQEHVQVAIGNAAQAVLEGAFS